MNRHQQRKPSRFEREELLLRGRPDYRLEKIYLAAMQRWGSGHDWYLVVDAQRCHAFATIEEMGIEDGDKLDLVKRQRGGKPVIYVFSPETLEAEVKLSLIPQWNLCAIYPVVPIKPRTARSNEQGSALMQMGTSQS